MIVKPIVYFGNDLIVACDACCNKAFGISGRAFSSLDENNDDDIEWHCDNELGDAPKDPGTYEGDHAKPTTKYARLNKWCVRACERSMLARYGEDFNLPDWSGRIKNIKTRGKTT